MPQPSPFRRVVALCALTCGAVAAQSADAPGASGPALTFVANAGQWDPALAAQARSGPATAWFHDLGLVLALEQRAEAPAPDRPAGALAGPPCMRVVGRAELRMTFRGARAVRPSGEDPTGGTVAFAYGADPSAWTTGAGVFRALRYAEPYPGIDAVFRADAASLVYDFHVAPDADTTAIEIACEGLERLAVRDDGALVMTTALGDVVHSAPQSFELGADGARRAVPSRFVLRGPDRFGFAVERGDPSLPLLIDPGIDWSSFFGGANVDVLHHSTSIDGRWVALTGQTSSASIPAPWSSNPNAGGVDVVVTIVDPRTSGAGAAIATVLLGGSRDDYPLDIDFDPTTGLFTVVGLTWSNDFPVTPNAMQSTFAGSTDAFLVQMIVGGGIYWASYLGTIGLDRLSDVRVTSGIITVAGFTNSAAFPLAGTPFQPAPAGGFDAVVARIDPLRPPASQLVSATYLGTGGAEGNWGATYWWGNWDLMNVDVDASDEVTVSFACGPGFPTTANALQPASGGGTDILFVRLDRALSQVRYATYIGGPLSDIPTDLDVDDQGVATIVGTCTGAGFPTTVGAFRRTPAGGGADVVLCRLDPSLPPAQQLLYGTYVGGSGTDETIGFVVDQSSRIAIVTGYTDSGDLPATVGAHRTTYVPPNQNGFVLRLALENGGARDLHYLSYVAHTQSAAASATALYCVSQLDDGRVLLCGLTNSPSFPVGNGGPQTAFPGGAPSALALMDLLPSGVTPIGAASPPCARPAHMQVSSAPRPGNAGFDFLCEGAPPRAIGALAMGFPSTTPTPVLGANLHIALPLFVTATVLADARGFARFHLPVPAAVRSPIGLGAQMLWIQPSPCGGGLLSAANALAF